MEVIFGGSGARAERTKGVIRKCNPKTATVECLEERGSKSSKGDRWKVYYSAMEPYVQGQDKTDILPVKRRNQRRNPEGRFPDDQEIVVNSTTFRSHYADGNPEWTVIEKRGRDAWLCEVKDDEDWQGTKKLFSTQEINASNGLSNYFDKLRDEGEAFYDSLNNGDIVHYNNGFKNYVRCKVGFDLQKGVSLLPVALVGEWKDFDLPRRDQYGTIRYGTYAQYIVDGTMFRPNASNIWEHKDNGKPDPRQLEPIDLSLPEPKADEQVLIELWIKVQHVRTILNEGGNDPQKILSLIQETVTT